MNRSVLVLVGRFLLIFVAVLALLAGIWRFAAPGYAWAVAGLAGPVFRLMEADDVTRIEARGDELWVLREIMAGRNAPFTWFDRYVFFAIIPLIALFAATPGLGLGARLLRTAGGLLVLLGVHVLYVVASVELSYAAIGLTRVGPMTARMLDAWQVMVRILWEAAPIAIWFSLTFSAWRRRFAGLRAESVRVERPGSATGLGTGWKAKEGTS